MKRTTIFLIILIIFTPKAPAQTDFVYRYDQTLHSDGIAADRSTSISIDKLYCATPEIIADTYLENTNKNQIEPITHNPETDTYKSILLDKPDTSHVVERIDILTNYPNPFNPETEISFKLKKEGKAVLTVYNIKGQRIMTLFDEFISKVDLNEIIKVKWDGKDEKGTKVSSGLYLYKLETEDKIYLRKMMLSK